MLMKLLTHKFSCYLKKHRSIHFQFFNGTKSQILSIEPSINNDVYICTNVYVFFIHLQSNHVKNIHVADHFANIVVQTRVQIYRILLHIIYIYYTYRYTTGTHLRKSSVNCVIRHSIKNTRVCLHLKGMTRLTMATDESGLTYIYIICMYICTYTVIQNTPHQIHSHK